MNGVLGVNVTKEYDTREFALGALVEVDGTVYEFGYASSAVTAYYGYTLDEDGVATAVAYSATLPAKVGFPQVSLSAGTYGWFARQGEFSVTVLDSCAKDVKLYTSATAGVLDDASSSQSLIEGLRIDTAAASSGGPHTVAGVATKLTVING